MTTHARFGDSTPFAEPAWYRGVPTPYYKAHHAAFRAKCRAWVEEHLLPHADAWDEAGHCPIEELRIKAAAAGLWCPWAPAEYGGTPPEGVWDEFMMLIWTDELSRCGSAGVAILFFITYMSLPHVLHFGTPKQLEDIAKPIIQGKAGMAITLTEPAGGSDLAGIRTTAVKVKLGGREFYRVNGQKKFITGGLCVDYFSTLVRTVADATAPPTRGHSDLSILVIPRNLKGVNVRKITTSGWWAGNTTFVDFEDVLVPVENLVGQEGMGFMVMATVMNGERLIACQSATRASRACLAEAIHFARERVTFGRPLIKSQVIRHKFAQMARRIEAAQAVTDNLAFAISQGAGAKAIGGSMALAKVECTSALEYCVREASQVLGGAAFVRGGKGKTVERIAREVRVAVVGGGSEEVMLDLAINMSKL